jgi:hypothetical protein
MRAVTEPGQLTLSARSWRAPSLATLWAFLAIALPALAALLATMPAVDLAYQLRAGGEILDARAIPTVDTWSATVAGTPWLDQQWGAQVLLALVYRATSWTGLAILRAVLVGLTCGLLLALVRRRAPRLAPLGATLLVLAAFTVMANALALRPQLFAIALFVLTLVLLADRTAHPRRLWAIPLLTILWANLHGTFPLVLVLLALALLADLLDRRSPRLVGAVTLASVAATLVNPFGLDVWRYVVNLATNPTISSRVSEWRPPSPTDPAGLLFYVSVLAVVALLVVHGRRAAPGTRRLPAWPGLLTLLIFGVAGAVTGRGLAWWPPAALFVIAPIAAEELGPLRLASSTRPSRVNGLVIAILVAAGVALLPAWRPLGAMGVPIGTLSYAPQGIAAALQPANLDRASVSGICGPSTNRIFVPQVWASWFELVAPEYHYEVDSRVELFPGYVWTNYDAVQAGDLVRACNYGYSWIVTMPGDTILEHVMTASQQWVPVYQDADGALWARH